MDKQTTEKAQSNSRCIGLQKQDKEETTKESQTLSAP